MEYAKMIHYFIALLAHGFQSNIRTITQNKMSEQFKVFPFYSECHQAVERNDIFTPTKNEDNLIEMPRAPNAPAVLRLFENVLNRTQENTRGCA